MSRAVRFSRHGGPEVLEVVEIPDPEPGQGEVLVEVFAAGLSPVDSVLRRGSHPDRWPVDLPAGVGRELAGVVAGVGPGVDAFSRGDEVMGFVDGGAQATHAVARAADLVPRPAGVGWEVAGSLHIAGTTAWSAVEGLRLTPDDTVVITAAAGGVGCLAAQFARLRGATVIGTSADARFDFLRQFGVIPLAYGPGLAERVRLAAGGRPVTAFLDFLGGEASVAIELGVPGPRILTTLDWDAVAEHGAILVEPGDPVLLARVAQQVAARRVRLPIADVFSLDDVVDAYRALDRRDAPGKIVLGVRTVEYAGQRVREPAIKEQDVTLGVPTPHEHVGVEEAVPSAIGDGSVRRRHREERDAREHG
ncbi:alcohol dehydrogenase catalytic domain-containing protein [Agromyces sp. CFH 90414]|uniref:Alcohol dehydrogenase catalytic domain-containing protein n=1 Tax=Agromyces agglutinans TaxID=2662258 RepID=A0A6I2FAM6_9MICO|nr:NADP-dependent oxidoreductase [Agromyces agglutinans]MRG60867.1 alcohol dehydrogenase catalytic domain-containing protein [Agromyces agglutinans]